MEANTPATATYPAGWYPDPHQRASHRWWDGATWTSHVNVNGQAHDESAGAGPPPAEASPVDAALHRIGSNRFLAYQEHMPSKLGGRIDIVALGGATVAVSEGEASTGFKKDVPIHLSEISGVRLAVLLRKFSAMQENHPVYAPDGVLLGQFLGPLGGLTLRVQTSAGIIGSLTYLKHENWFMGSSGRPLARIIRMQGAEMVGFGFDVSPMLGGYVLELIEPMPPWMLMYALLAPVDIGARAHSGRSMLGF